MTDILLSVMLAVLMLAAAAYAQFRLAEFTRQESRLVARAVLALVGVGLGLVAASYVERSFEQVLAFLGGFGLVHVPAAIVLYLKGLRGDGRS